MDALKEAALPWTLTLQKYFQDRLSDGKFGVGTPSNGPKRVPLGITPVLQTPSVCGQQAWGLATVTKRVFNVFKAHRRVWRRENETGLQR